MIEVKHTDNYEYQISGGNLQKRIGYAKSMNYELYFAISIKGYWMVFSADYIQKNNGKITTEDYFNSELDSIFSTCSYLFLSKIKIVSTYSKCHNKKLPICYKEYGNLISYKFYADNKLIFKVKGKNSIYLPYVYMLEALQDRISSSKYSVDEKDGLYIITESTDNSEMIPEYKFLLSTLEHIGSREDKKYDAHRLIQESKADRSNLINPDILLILRSIIRDLAIKHKVMVTYQISNTGYIFN